MAENGVFKYATVLLVIVVIGLLLTRPSTPTQVISTSSITTSIYPSTTTYTTQTTTVSNPVLRDVALLVSVNEGASSSGNTWALPKNMEGAVIPIEAIGYPENTTVTFNSDAVGSFITGGEPYPNTCTFSTGGDCIVAYMLPSYATNITITAQVGDSTQSTVINLQ